MNFMKQYRTVVIAVVIVEFFIYFTKQDALFDFEIIYYVLIEKHIFSSLGLSFMQLEDDFF